MTAPANFQKMVSDPRLKESEIIQGLVAGDHLWLFANSRTGPPFSIDARSGQVCPFDGELRTNLPPNASPHDTRLSGTGKPDLLHACLFFPHLDAALVDITGPGLGLGGNYGDRWFWMSLKSGIVHQLPAGWQLLYFSADESIAVFSQPHNFEVPLHGIEMKTGEPVVTLPSVLQPYVDWNGGTDRSWRIDLVDQTAQAIFTRKASTNALDYFWGFTVAGQPYSFVKELTEAPYYYPSAKTKDGFIGFLLGQPHINAPKSLGLIPIDPNGKLDRVESTVGGSINPNFLLLAHGVYVYVEDFHRPSGLSQETFVHVYGTPSTQNVLDGIERLPELPKAIADEPWIMDDLSVRLIESFGQDPKRSAGLCLFRQFRRDERQTVPPQVAPATWQRAVVVTSDGRRVLTNLFRAGPLPDEVWLHDSGTMITGQNSWDPPGFSGVRQVHLEETRINLPSN